MSSVKITPLLMKGPLVLASLAGDKTQTRRTRGLEDVNVAPQHFELAQYGTERDQPGAFFTCDPDQPKIFCACPYGGPGDLIYVRETHAFDKQVDYIKPSDLSKGEPVYYHADGVVRTTGCQMIEKGKTRVSIHMPRWASRLTLLITDVRVERLGEISEEDAKAEGVTERAYPLNGGGWMRDDGALLSGGFASLWESINGTGTWSPSTFVWVIKYQAIPHNVDSAVLFPSRVPTLYIQQCGRAKRQGVTSEC